MEENHSFSEAFSLDSLNAIVKLTTPAEVHIEGTQLRPLTQTPSIVRLPTSTKVDYYNRFRLRNQDVALSEWTGSSWYRLYHRWS